MRTIAWYPSPNFGPRRKGAAPELVVLHYTAMDSAEAALSRLCNPAAEVSAHYLIGRCGKIWQLVAEEARAWHAGQSSWQGKGDVNSRSIGIELDNDGASPFSRPQIEALEWLLAQILERWKIPASGVIAHSDVAPERKSDPGPRFDWRGLALAGLALWPQGLGRADVPLDSSLDRIGYPKVSPELRLRAFRLRFRPFAKGPEGPDDRACADAVAAALAEEAQGATRCGPTPR